MIWSDWNIFFFTNIGRCMMQQVRVYLFRGQYNTEQHIRQVMYTIKSLIIKKQTLTCGVPTEALGFCTSLLSRALVSCSKFLIFSWAIALSWLYRCPKASSWTSSELPETSAEPFCGWGEGGSLDTEDLCLDLEDPEIRLEQLPKLSDRFSVALQTVGSKFSGIGMPSGLPRMSVSSAIIPDLFFE